MIDDAELRDTFKNPYPEHDKLRKIADMKSACHEFLDWLEEQGYSIEAQKPHMPFFNANTILNQFFEIDAKKLEAERRAMLDETRNLNMIIQKLENDSTRSLNTLVDHMQGKKV